MKRNERKPSERPESTVGRRMVPYPGLPSELAWYLCPECLRLSRRARKEKGKQR